MTAGCRCRDGGLPGPPRTCPACGPAVPGCRNPSRAGVPAGSRPAGHGWAGRPGCAGRSSPPGSAGPRCAVPAAASALPGRRFPAGAAAGSRLQPRLWRHRARRPRCRATPGRPRPGCQRASRPWRPGSPRPGAACDGGQFSSPGRRARGHTGPRAARSPAGRGMRPWPAPAQRRIRQRPAMPGTGAPRRRRPPSMSVTTVPARTLRSCARRASLATSSSGSIENNGTPARTS